MNKSKHKARLTSGQKKTTAIVALLGIFIAIVITTGFITRGFSEWNRFCWFGHDYEAGVCVRCGAEQPAEDEQEPVTAVDNEGNILSPNKVYEMPQGIVFASANLLEASTSAGNTVTIRATVTPDNATDKTVHWTVEWASATSAFASGKNVTDYVTVTPGASDTLTAAVTCLQPFGEKILVKATAEADTDVSAMCTVDYVKKVTGIKSFDVVGGFSFTTNTCTYEAETTPYTIDAETVISVDSVHYFELFVTDMFPDIYNAYADEIGEADLDVDEFYDMWVNPDLSCNTSDFSFDPATLKLTFAYNSFTALFLQVYQDVHEDDPVFDGAYYQYLQEYPYSPALEVTVKTVLNGTVISSVTKTFIVDVDLSQYVVGVSDITLSQGSIQF